MHPDLPPSSAPAPDSGGPWYKLLTRYHWFVFVVAALGWLFDTMDQQLFNLGRVPAMRELLQESPGVPPDNAVVAEYAGYATSIFLIGWATGGIFFGILGDRIGRVKTMLLTILVYSVFTGLSALSQSFWDFALWRFLTGLGVGGEFAVGVALVAEVMPERARPFALGLLQALSAVGNMTAALIAMTGVSWRVMFAIGTAPALLSILVRRRLREPERWQAISTEEGVQKHLGSYRELFGDPRWRKNAIVGLLMASAGVIGLWGIGFFSIDLTRLVFRQHFEQEYRQEGEAKKDRQLVLALLHHPTQLTAATKKIKPGDLLNTRADAEDTQAVLAVMPEVWRMHLVAQAIATVGIVQQSEDSLVAARAALASGFALKPGATFPAAVLGSLEKSKDPRRQAVARDVVRSGYLDGEVPPVSDIDSHVARVQRRKAELEARLTRWAGITSLVLNFGAFFGIYLFSYVSHALGRKPTFGICFILAMFSTAGVFWFLGRVGGFSDVFWMIPIMGFCQLSLFGGYAIYFPELFPTRLRSTGTSFCYNIGRFVAALGPFTLGLLTSRVFVGLEQEPMRYAGVAMCAVFLVGLAALPFAPETRGKPLPE